MHDPHEGSGRLTAFAHRLAGELPGHWHSTTYRTPQHEAELAELHDGVWDTGQIAESLATHSLEQAAVLTREGAQLVVVDRHEALGFLIAPLIPRGLPLRAFRDVGEPSGIALPADPLASAGLVDGLLLRYDAALAQAHHNAIALARDAPGPGTPQADRVVLNWQPDGSLTTTPGSEAAATVLATGGFVRDEQDGTYRLSGDDTAEQARAVRETGRRLDAHGISIALQHPADRTAAPAPPATPSPPAARAHRR